MRCFVILHHISLKARVTQPLFQFFVLPVIHVPPNSDAEISERCISALGSSFELGDIGQVIDFVVPDPGSRRDPQQHAVRGSSGLVMVLIISKWSCDIYRTHFSCPNSKDMSSLSIIRIFQTSGDDSDANRAGQRA